MGNGGATCAPERPGLSGFCSVAKTNQPTNERQHGLPVNHSRVTLTRRQLRAFSNTLSLMRRRIPRAVNLVAQGVVFPALFVGAPVSLSQRGRRYGWSAGRPGPVNLVGALPLGAGAALLLWAMSSHYRAAPQGWETRPTPDYLLTGGPYRVSRNPMYVGETAIWAGWAVLLAACR